MNRELQFGKAKISVYADTFSKRVRIDDYEGPLPEVHKLIRRETSDWVEKLIVKSKAGDLSFFLSEGFKQEAKITGYYSGSDMYFLVLYLTPARSRSKKWDEEEAILAQVLNLKKDSKDEQPVKIEIAGKEDAAKLADLYAEVFEVYPTPIAIASYIEKTIEEGTQYVCVRDQERIVCAASAEVNLNHRNAELTDCASLREAQGKGYMKKLLLALEERLVSEGITCFYTIARAESFGMNKAFFQLGYIYEGRLINNCVIYSGMEDMNVWSKIVAGPLFV